MRVALGSDERTALTERLENELRGRGCDLVLFGALTEGGDEAWPSVGRRVGEAVASGECQSGVVCCWSGTGVSIAANKVAGARAALCADAETAALARIWNDANVLALSLRSTPPGDVPDILERWFGERPTEDPVYRPMIGQIS